MKHSLALMTLFISGIAMAQQDPLQGMAFNKKNLDSLMAEAQKKMQPLILQAPGPENDPNTIVLNSPLTFKDYNPGATLLNKTSRGTVYSLPPDNMAVLVPNMNTVSKMPGSSQAYKPAPPSVMPNPLYPSKPPAKRKKD